MPTPRETWKKQKHTSSLTCNETIESKYSPPNAQEKKLPWEKGVIYTKVYKNLAEVMKSVQ
jgi:hypothetical protein